MSRSSVASYIVSGAIGLTAALLIFTLPVLLGTGRFWDAPNYPDMQQHLAAARYFLADAWRFPLFLCKLIMPPDGVSVVFLDINPLFALFGKILFSISGIRINYFGPWIAICYGLQGAAFVFLCRSLGLRGLVPAIAATIVALSIPEFLFRYFHLNLLGQFFIEIQLGFYFRAVRSGRFRQFSTYAMALSLVGLTVHFYLFAMIAAIYAALLLQWAQTARAAIKRALIHGAIFLVGTAIIFVGSGYLHGAGGTTGFGYFSMNILSPFMPQASGVFPGMTRIIDGTGGQYEGYNYLGIGVILLFLLSLYLCRLDLIPLAKRYRALLALMVVFTLFAISFDPFAGNLSLRHPFAEAHSAISSVDAAPVATPSPGMGAKLRALIFYPLQQFRSSGRFFWPVGYCIAAFGIVGVARRMPRIPAMAILSIAAVLQFVDAGPVRNHVAQEMRAATKPPLPPDPWERLIAAHGGIRVLPSMDCAGAQSVDIPLLVFYASQSVTPTQSAKLSRGPAANCPAEIAGIAHYALGADEVLFVLSPPVPAEIAGQIPEAASLCRPFPLGFVCSHKWRELDEAGISIGG